MTAAGTLRDVPNRKTFAGAPLDPYRQLYSASETRRLAHARAPAAAFSPSGIP
jgi:hypothetical protein